MYVQNFYSSSLKLTMDKKKHDPQNQCFFFGKFQPSKLKQRCRRCQLLLTLQFPNQNKFHDADQTLLQYLKNSNYIAIENFKQDLILSIGSDLK